MSSTALEVRNSGRVFPFVENRVIEKLRKGISVSRVDLMAELIDPSSREEYSQKRVESHSSFAVWRSLEFITAHKAYNILRCDKGYMAVPQTLGTIDLNDAEALEHPLIHWGEDAETLKNEIDAKKLPFAEKAKIVGNYKGYNTLRFGHGYFAVPQWVGELNLLNAADYQRPELLFSESITNLKAEIRRAANQVPVFRRSVKTTIKKLVPRLIGQQGYFFLAGKYRQIFQ